MKYHPASCDALTTEGKPLLGPWQVGSLTGAVASESSNGGARKVGSARTVLALIECNGRSQPDGETDGSSRHESGP